jgi:hypothetical protein
MTSFRLTVLTAGFVSIVISMFDAFYPSEKFNRQMNVIFTLVLILCTITPVLSGKVGIPDISELVNETNLETEECVGKADEYFKRSVERNISSRIGQYLYENQIECTQIDTNINISDSGSISINEIDVTACDAALEGDIVDLIQKYIGEDIYVKARESSEDDS